MPLLQHSTTFVPLGCRFNASFTLDHRSRRWPNIDSTFVQAETMVIFDDKTHLHKLRFILIFLIT